MAENSIRFDDGALYESTMGVWSRLAGTVFLDWLQPDRGWRWLDVGCGNGAFSQLIADSLEPKHIDGIDPSAGQIAFAQARPASRVADFRQGDATALPYGDNAFDAAAMALVIAFVPQPATGVSEMVRVTRPGGLVGAYMWDFAAKASPVEPIATEADALGYKRPAPPSASAAARDVMDALWTAAGLEAVETRTIEVTRTFADFEDFWSVTTSIGSLAALFPKLPTEEAARIKERVRGLTTPDSSGRIVRVARANAVKGRVPR